MNRSLGSSLQNRDINNNSYYHYQYLPFLHIFIAAQTNSIAVSDQNGDPCTLSSPADSCSMRTRRATGSRQESFR